MYEALYPQIDTRSRLGGQPALSPLKCGQVHLPPASPLVHLSVNKRV